MKNRILIMSAAIALVALSGCRKDMTFTADTSSWATDSSVCITLANKKDAKEVKINWGDNTWSEPGELTSDASVCHDYEYAGTYSITVVSKNHKAERLSITLP